MNWFDPRSLLFVVLLAVATGCSSPYDSTGSPPAGASSPEPAPPPTDPAEALAQLSEAVFDAFENSTTVEPLIYPKGWVKRKQDPEAVSEELLADDDGQPRAIVRLVFTRKHSMIHPDETAATLDEELLPYPPGPSREAMQENPLVRAYEPVELEIHYDWTDRGWQRREWKSQPEIAQARDWLDRLDVP